MISRFPASLVLMIMATTPSIACDLKVSNAWIREAPPGMMTLAGYASLANTGNQLLRIAKVQSSLFTAIQMHESSISNGIASMRAIDTLELSAHQTVSFAPNGKHFMLMGVRQALKQGDIVVVQFQYQHGCRTDATFTVRNTPE